MDSSKAWSSTNGARSSAFRLRSKKRGFNKSNPPSQSSGRNSTPPPLPTRRRSTHGSPSKKPCSHRRLRKPNPRCPPKPWRFSTPKRRTKPSSRSSISHRLPPGKNSRMASRSWKPSEPPCSNPYPPCPRRSPPNHATSACSTAATGRTSPAPSSSPLRPHSSSPAKTSVRKRPPDPPRPRELDRRAGQSAHRPRLCQPAVGPALRRPALSKDTGDLGFQGEYPSHPELLDWLAVEFMENQWSVKHLMRTILLSRTYQQSSTPSPALAETDPQNRLLARQSQLRLPAELIRDNALAVSGLLNPTIGGPSAKPYQPDGYYRHLNFPRRTYQQDKGGLGLSARTLHALAAHLPPPDAQGLRRSRARRMHRRHAPPPTPRCRRSTCSTTPPSPRPPAPWPAACFPKPEGETDLIARAWLRCLSRPPTAEESEILGEFHAQELERFTANPDAAALLLAVGGTPPPKELPPVRLAAATSLARAILNLHETITRY